MTRAKRNYGISGYNHCIVRGINKRDIFFDEQDRYKFINVLKEFKKQHCLELENYYENFAEFELVKKLTDEQVKDMIDIAKAKMMKDEKNFLEKSERYDLLKEILNVRGVSVNQLSRVMGISRKLLTRLKSTK